MMSMFNSFDQSNTMIPMTGMMMTMIIINKMYKMSINSKIMYLYMNFMLKIMISMSKEWSKNMMTMMKMIMMVMVSMNLSSMMPYVFTMTSQVSNTMLMPAMMWLMMTSFSTLNNMKKTISHLIPEGSPIYMSFFILMIEIISNMIRPVTLTIRMVANITSGHLMMKLLFNMSTSMKPMSALLLGLTNVEMAVAMIQSYIMITLMIMYYSEM